MASNSASDRPSECSAFHLNGGSKGTPWSESETQQLKLLLKDREHSVRAIAKRLGRSVPSVKSRMNRLNFLKGDRAKPWTSEDVERLRALFEGEVTQAKMATLLRRNAGTIRAKLHHLGLKRPPKYTKIAP